jgi:hypothetical protein
MASFLGADCTTIALPCRSAQEMAWHHLASFLATYRTIIFPCLSALTSRLPSRRTSNCISSSGSLSPVFTMAALAYADCGCRYDLGGSAEHPLEEQ